MADSFLSFIRFGFLLFVISRKGFFGGIDDDGGGL